MTFQPLFKLIKASKRCNTAGFWVSDWKPVSPHGLQEADEFRQFQNVGVTWSFCTLWMVMTYFFSYSIIVGEALVICLQVPTFSNKNVSFFFFFYYQLQSMFLVLSSAVSKTRSTSSLLSPPPVVLPFYLSLKCNIYWNGKHDFKFWGEKSQHSLHKHWKTWVPILALLWTSCVVLV